jgi:arylsulfatase A-like enzyme
VAPRATGPDTSGDYFQTPRAEAVVDRAVEALDRHDPDYLYVQPRDPHTPYSRPADEVDRFVDAPPPHPTAEAIRDHRTWDAWRGARDAGIDDRGDLRDLLAAYDAEVADADAHVGRPLDALRERDRYDRSCVVLLADHGEEFGERGLYSEHWSTHEGTQRVPLVVKPPADAPRRDRTDALATTVDAAATVLAYAGLDAPDAWQGTSLRGHVAGGPAPTDALVVDHGLSTAQRAVRTDRWKPIRTYEAGLWDAVVPGTQLFDLDADPWETTDLAADNPDVVADLAATREAWVDAHVGPGGDALADAVANGLGGAEIYGDGYDGV